MRWWWLVAALSAIAVLVLVGPILTTSSTHLGFLSGQKPLDLSASHTAPKSDIGITYRAYTFKGNFRTVEQAARKELLANGFRETRPGLALNDYSCFLRIEPGSSPADAMRPFEEVMINKDMHLNNDGMANRNFSDQDGWVTVLIQTRAPKSALTRFGEWIGL